MDIGATVPIDEQIGSILIAEANVEEKDFFRSWRRILEGEKKCTPCILQNKMGS